jgi:hypothetical protein
MPPRRSLEEAIGQPMSATAPEARRFNDIVTVSAREPERISAVIDHFLRWAL